MKIVLSVSLVSHTDELTYPSQLSPQTERLLADLNGTANVEVRQTKRAADPPDNGPVAVNRSSR
jgi:hypothetical protein